MFWRSYLNCCSVQQGSGSQEDLRVGTNSVQGRSKKVSDQTERYYKPAASSEDKAPDWQCYGYAGLDKRLPQPGGTRPIPLPLPQQISHRVRGETARPNRTPPSFHYNDSLRTPSKTPSKRLSRPGTPGTHHRHDRHLTDSQRKKLAASIQHDRTIVDANYDDDSNLDFYYWDEEERKNRKDREQRKK